MPLEEIMRISPTGRWTGGRNFMQQYEYAYGGRMSDMLAQARAARNEFLRHYPLVATDYASIEMRILRIMLDGVPPLLRLKGPSDRDAGNTNGTAISIMWLGKPGVTERGTRKFDTAAMPWPTRQIADMIGGLCAGWGCPHKVCLRVADALYASGRYDCVIGASEHGIQNLEDALRQHGATVKVTDDNPKFNARGQRDFR